MLKLFKQDAKLAQLKAFFKSMNVPQPYLQSSKVWLIFSLRMASAQLLSVYNEIQIEGGVTHCLFQESYSTYDFPTTLLNTDKRYRPILCGIIIGSLLMECHNLRNFRFIMIESIIQ